jgi:hypothetical protein
LKSILNILLIISILFTSSCGVFKDSEIDEDLGKGFSDISSPNGFSSGNEAKDEKEISFIKREISVVSSRNVPKDGAPFRDVEGIDVDVDVEPTSNVYVNTENLNITDNTSDTSNNSSKGTIAYSVPKEMQVGESYQVKLRITKEKGKEINKTLIIGEREIPIADSDIQSKVTIEHIRVERSMKASLISEDESFNITPLNTENQILEDESYTEWGWIVSPLESGKHYLKLIIKIKIEIEGESSYKDIVVFDKNIEVKSNLKYGIKSWFSSYWQWLLSSIIIPLVIFLYKKRKDKKKEQ